MAGAECRRTRGRSSKRLSLKAPARAAWSHMLQPPPPQSCPHAVLRALQHWPYVLHLPVLPPLHIAASVLPARHTVCAAMFSSHATYSLLSLSYARNRRVVRLLLLSHCHCCLHHSRSRPQC